MNMKLEVVLIPVSDVDRAKAFYEKVGFPELSGRLEIPLHASPIYLSIKAPWLINVVEAKRRNSSTTE